MKLEIHFLSKETQSKIHNKKNRKNKKRRFYKWKLERLIESIEENTSYQIDYFPSTSNLVGIQKVKDLFIEQLNSTNFFGSKYHPKEKDYLSIIYSKDRDEYLNLIFINNEWKEEYFLNSLRIIGKDIYSEIENGELEILLT